MHSHAQLPWAVLDVGILFHSVTHLSPLRRCLLNKCLYCLHGQPRHFFIYTLWFFILFCFFVESKAFIHSPSEERGLVWRHTSIEGWGFVLLLDYNWIKKRWRVCCRVAPGLWEAAVCPNVIFCLWL